MPPFEELARRIQASILAAASRGRDVRRIGPFVATFNREDANPFLNYAVPDEGAAPSRAEIEALAAAYRERGRRPRLEYVPFLAPAVEPGLLEAGFAVELRTPLMTCSSPRAVRHVAAPGFELVAPATDEEYLAAAAVQWEAYEEEGEVPQRVIDGLRRTAEAGGAVVLARAANGAPAGAGLCTAPEDGLTELTSVAVRPPFRRRGVAAAMAGRLAGEAFARGGQCVFLMAHGEPEERIYARAGFETRSEVLHVSRA